MTLVKVTTLCILSIFLETNDQHQMFFKFKQQSKYSRISLDLIILDVPEDSIELVWLFVALNIFKVATKNNIFCFSVFNFTII